VGPASTERRQGRREKGKGKSKTAKKKGRAIVATFSRHVDVDWIGSVTEGKGQVNAGTGAFSLPVTFAARIGEPAGQTSPEELIAAAHAACYAMALNATVGRKGGSIARTRVTATVIADKSDAGIKLTTSRLSVVAEGLQGLEKAQFADVAREAEGRCPISNALRGSLSIELETDVR
jgi:lipoyl-dependent peroxiredoxin